MTEEWRPIDGFDGHYAVSNIGRVHSRHRGGGLLAPVLDGRGYPTVRLCAKGKPQRFFIHRLVCEAFHGPAATERPHVAHLDGDPLNPVATNLQWVSRSENEAHKRLHGRVASGSRNGRAKLTENEVAAIRCAAQFQSCSELAAQYEVHKSTIARVIRGERYSEATKAGLAPETVGYSGLIR